MRIDGVAVSPAGVNGDLRVLLVDDRDTGRNGLRSSLQSEAGVKVVGAAATINEALQLVAQTDPQLIVSEQQIAGQSVVELIEALSKGKFAPQVLVFTDQGGEIPMRLAISAGARAYMLKDDGYPELMVALRSVGAGRRFFSDSVESRILAQYAERVAARFNVAAAPITPREREVLARVGQGQTNKTIAKALLLSVKTVEKHRSNLMRKLGLHNTAAVTAYAIRQGLISQDTIGGAA